MDPTTPPSDPNLPYDGHYHRPAEIVGSSASLQALADGYFGLSIVFGVNVILALGLNLGVSGFAGYPTLLEGPALALYLLGMFVAISLLSLPHNKRIAIGKGWSPSAGILASVLMGLNSALCCGIIGFVVMQHIAGSEMKRMGVVPRMLRGIRKVDVAAAKNRLLEQEQLREHGASAPTFDS